MWPQEAECPQLGDPEAEQSMEDGQGGGHGQGDHPDPEDQVHLLIDHVQGQQAQGVMIL